MINKDFWDLVAKKWIVNEFRKEIPAPPSIPIVIPEDDETEKIDDELADILDGLDIDL